MSLALKKSEKSFTKSTAKLQETVFRDEYIEGIMGVVWENSLNWAVRSLTESGNTKLEKASENLKTYFNKVLQTLIALTKPGLNEFDVVCHGDLWNNNIMLR